MIDIPAIFKNKEVDGAQLLVYGFHLVENGYEKDVMILNDQFIAKVFITVEGKGDFKVYEADTLEEYMPAHIYNASGAFVGEIHKACESVLKDIAQKCFLTELFKWDQSKRILQFIKDSYGAEPEFLWKILRRM